MFSVTSLLEYCLGITDVLLCLMHSSSSLVLMTSALSIVSLFIKILFAASFDCSVVCSSLRLMIHTVALLQSTLNFELYFQISCIATLCKAKEWLEVYFHLPLVTANNFIAQ